MSTGAKQAKSCPIPTRVLTLKDWSQLPDCYSQTPGGTLFSTTPGGKKISQTSASPAEMFKKKRMSTLEIWKTRADLRVKSQCYLFWNSTPKTLRSAFSFSIRNIQSKTTGSDQLVTREGGWVKLQAQRCDWPVRAGGWRPFEEHPRTLCTVFIKGKGGSVYALNVVLFFSFSIPQKVLQCPDLLLNMPFALLYLEMHCMLFTFQPTCVCKPASPVLCFGCLCPGWTVPTLAHCITCFPWRQFLNWYCTHECKLSFWQLTHPHF